jgi:MFS superfamily sulfate permease-like transporter
VPGTNSYSDIDRHPENEPLTNLIAFRPEASLLYVNVGSVFETVIARVHDNGPGLRAALCDLSASPHLDLAGARMLNALHDEVAGRGIALQIVGARGRVRDLLRADGLAAKVGGIERTVSLDDVIRGHH